MSDAASTTVFAGVDDRTDAQLPDWYARRTDTREPVSFATALRNLPRAVETTVAYFNPHADAWEATDRFTALVEPDRLREQARTAAASAGEPEPDADDGDSDVRQ